MAKYTDYQASSTEFVAIGLGPRDLHFNGIPGYSDIAENTTKHNSAKPREFFIDMYGKNN